MKAGHLAFAGAAVLAASTVLASRWTRRNLVLITVRGDSMTPTYRNGQRLVVRRGGYSAGEVVVFRPPSRRIYDVDWIVKRAVAVAGDPVPADLTEQAAAEVVPAGRLLVRSDAPDGLDSRQLGLIDDRDVLGVVRYPRP
jgi:signal peptidase I